MDPITDLPAMAEPGAHIAHAANPTPTHAPNHNHPPYAEMITAAIAALKDKDGSSRQAIAKYIEKAYANLPPSHSTLLTTHLKRLKNNGQLVMIKHSYALPRSAPFPIPSPTAEFPAANASFSGPKRKPGRPPKARPDLQFQHPMSITVTEPGPGPVPESHVYSVAAPGFGHEAPVYPVAAPGYGPEVPAYSVAAPGFGSEVQAYPGVETGTGQGFQTYPVGGPEPMFVSLGLDDGPVAPPSMAAPTSVIKRGRGRPPKASNGPVATDSSGPTSLGKRARGRPIKPRSITEIMSNGGLKKARGRPRVTAPVIVPLAGGSPRPQGRPKKGRSSGPKPTGRPRGRPAKNGVKVVPLDVLGGGVVSARRPGRPARNGVAKMPRKLTGKPMGRPRKSSAVTAVLVTDPQQLVAYQELKKKLEHIQSKIKQTVNVVRPCLNHEGAVNALGALLELEILATGEASAPVNDHGEEPPPQLLHDQENLF